MPTFFNSFTDAELEELIDELKAELLAIIKGERFVTVSVGGKTFTRPIRNSSEVKRDLADAEMALNGLSSKTFTNFNNDME